MKSARTLYRLPGWNFDLATDYLNYVPRALTRAFSSRKSILNEQLPSPS